MYRATRTDQRGEKIFDVYRQMKDIVKYSPLVLLCSQGTSARRRLAAVLGYVEYLVTPSFLDAHNVDVTDRCPHGTPKESNTKNSNGSQKTRQHTRHMKERRKTLTMP